MKSYIIILVLLLGIAGCTREEAVNDNTNRVLAERNVVVAEAVRKDLYSGLSLSGRIESDVYVNVSPALAAKIEKIHVREGSNVKKGDLLLELQDLNLIQAEENFRNLERNYRRMSELFRNDAVDQKSYEEIKSAYEVAKSAYEFTLENTRVRAPIDGKIVSIALKEGETYNPMMLPALVRILSLNQMKAVTHLSDRDFLRTGVGMKAMIRVDAAPDEVIEGTISFISSEADPFNGTFRCEITINRVHNALRHNQFARIIVTTDEARDAVIIPQTAIVNGNMVYVVSDGKAHRRVVETGISSNDEVAVMSGVSEGDKVIILGNVGLSDQYPVNIIE